MKSLISKESIIAKAGVGSSVPFIGGDGKFHTLYMTTCLLDGKVYVGVRSTKKEPHADRYIGCGIRSEMDRYKINAGKSKFVSYVSKFGYHNFKRENILYYPSREDVLSAEARVVDKDFVRSRLTLNITLGGNQPPILLGKSNGNYGKNWTLEQKISLSETRIKNGKSSGALNGMAKECQLIDLYDDSVSQFQCLTYLSESLSLNYRTVLKFTLYKRVIAKRYMAQFIGRELSGADIASAVQKSRYYNVINRRRVENDCKEY